MQLTKISRSKSFEMINEFGLKAWDKFGLEGDLGDKEDPLQAYSELGKVIDESFKVSYPENPNQERVRQADKPEPSKEIQSILSEVEKCLTPDELSGYWLVCKGNLTLSTAYKAKEKLLTNAK
jgi:hypothetical protein